MTWKRRRVGKSIAGERWSISKSKAQVSTSCLCLADQRPLGLSEVLALNHLTHCELEGGPLGRGRSRRPKATWWAGAVGSLARRRGLRERSVAMLSRRLRALWDVSPGKVGESVVERSIALSSTCNCWRWSSACSVCNSSSRRVSRASVSAACWRVWCCNSCIAAANCASWAWEARKLGGSTTESLIEEALIRKVGRGGVKEKNFYFLRVHQATGKLRIVTLPDRWRQFHQRERGLPIYRSSLLVNGGPKKACHWLWWRTPFSRLGCPQG